MEKISLTFEEIIKFLPEKTNLYYIDYRDSFDNNLKELQEAMHDGDYSHLEELCDFNDYDAVTYEYDELIGTIDDHYDIDYAKEIMEDFEEDIRDEIRSRDVSTPLNDLIKNTSKQPILYDTGFSVEEGSWSWNESIIRAVRMEIKRQLNIMNQCDEKHNQAIDMMIRQASYGGRLVVYFYDNPGDWIDIDQELNTISFTGYVSIAIVNTYNGSGDSTELHKVSIELPFNRENLYIDRCLSYNYSFDVCGMISNWCDGTNVSLSVKQDAKVAEVSSMKDFVDKEAELDRIFKEGGCTIGDMKYSRHRNVIYINEFPCGHKCLDCGTFWID